MVSWIISSWRTEYKTKKIWEATFDRIRSWCSQQHQGSEPCAQTLELTSHFSARISLIFLSRLLMTKSTRILNPTHLAPTDSYARVPTQEWETNERAKIFRIINNRVVSAPDGLTCSSTQTPPCVHYFLLIRMNVDSFVLEPKIIPESSSI